MNNRLNKPKKFSKIKGTVNNQRFAYNSPAKFATTTTGLSSGCCPKQPPNISNHFLEKRKQHQIKGEYYVMGKQNKGRMMNNFIDLKQYPSHLDTIDRLRDKRNTHNFINHQTHKLLEVRKSNPHQNNLKTIHKSKLHRNPIPLGSMKSQKSKLNRPLDKEKQNKQIKMLKNARKQLKQRSLYIGQDLQCHEKCFQNISSYSIAHSKAQSYFHDVGTLDQSHNLIEKQISIQSSKRRFQRSPKILSPSGYFKIPEKTPEQQIAEFEEKINQINTNFQHDSLTCMQAKDFQYIQSKNLNCYLGNQRFMDWKKRAMTIDWLIQLISEIGGKRQTLANAVNIFDRYLSVTTNIPIDYVQCIAVSCLLIAAKMEDKSLSASYLAESTQDKYTPDQIIETEYKIFQALNFKVNTPTLNSWANRLAAQWDLYLDSVDLRGFNIFLSNLKSLKFKNGDQISYYNFRWLCQYVDFSIMDIYTLRYQPRMLSLAFIYIILVMRLNLYSKEQVVNIFPYSSQFLMQKTEFHQFFSTFMTQSFNQSLMDLLPMIQYCSSFVILQLDFNLPEVIPEPGTEDQQNNIHYQNFCCYQTKNKNTLSYLCNRNRNVF